MPEEDADTSAQKQESEDAKVVQDSILGTEDKSSEKAEEVTEDKAGEEKEKPEAKEETKSEEGKEKPAEAVDEEAEVVKVLSRFKGTPEEVAKQLAKAYRAQEKMHGEHSDELGKLRKEVLDFKNFKDDWNKDPKAVLARLTELAGGTESEKEKTKEALIEALNDPTGKALDKYIQERVESTVSEKESEREWRDKQEKLMRDRHPGWDERKAQRKALLDSIKLDQFPYPDEILDLAVRGTANPEKVFEDAKKAAREEDKANLAKKADQQVETQKGGPREEKEPSDSEIVEAEILTADELERAT